MLLRFGEITLSFVALAAFLVTIEVGYRIGWRHRSENSEDAKSHITALQTALLGLLALLLGFNFAMASARFDSRKALIQDEVNAIGSAYLRAELLPPEQAQQLIPALRGYLDTRINFMQAGGDEMEVKAMSKEAARADARIWELTEKIVADNPGSWSQSFFAQSVNEMINVKWKRSAALDNHVPEEVIYLLFLVAIGALGFIAYSYGIRGTRRHFSTAFFAVLISFVLATILDFDRPNGGFIQVSDEEMLRLKAAISEQGG